MHAEGPLDCVNREGLYIFRASIPFHPLVLQYLKPDAGCPASLCWKNYCPQALFLTETKGQAVSKFCN